MSVPTSVCPNVPTRLPLDRLRWNLIFGTSTNICRVDSNLAKIGQKQLAFYTGTSVRLQC